MDIETIINHLEKSGSDKQFNHNYSVAYHKFLSGKTIKNFLEIGIANQDIYETSLYAWKNIFPEAHIYGIDNDPEKMITDIEGISTFVCDQNSAEDLNKFIESCKNIKFDVILDDGSHYFEHAKTSYEFLFDRLSENGIYLIEDIYKNSISDQQNVNQWVSFLELQNNIMYDVFDCRPEVNDNSVVIAIWRK